MTLSERTLAGPERTLRVAIVATFASGEWILRELCGCQAAVPPDLIRGPMGVTSDPLEPIPRIGGPFTARDYMTRGAIHVDHIGPVANGGAMYDPRNLQATCRRCNLSKGSKTPPNVWAAWQ